MKSTNNASSTGEMKPFDGIRVIDFTHVLAGPSATYQLGVLGADVIKVEFQHEPDMMRNESQSPEMAKQGRGTEFICQNGNKRSLSLDLKTDSGLAITKRLIESADVLVENYRYGVMTRYGLGYDDARALNPSVIYCSLTGFGHSGPKASHPAYDVVIQAYSGLMAANGSAENEKSPVRVGPAILDYGTGAYAAFAISSALFQRSRTGLGQFIDVSMSDAALMLMSNSVMVTQCRDQAPPPYGNMHPVKVGYSAYSTAKGFLMLGAFTFKQLRNLCRTIGLERLADSLSEVNNESLIARYDELVKNIQEALAKKTADEWEIILNEAGVPAARVRRIDETLNSDQVKSRQVLKEFDEIPETGKPLSVPVAAFQYQHGGPSVTRQSPRLGEHTLEILIEMGYTSSEIENFVSSGAIYHLQTSNDNEN
ncbi:MAG: formyl-CoA transferase [Acidiferrobacteraceae bacterium]|nr:formyl-CoA transferase [Acidiferrobacteraceae bacterium]|tara:strand:+ start:5674 stop:6948 length:1275 start_codon:yes stop_codon:yes gene_type:complete